MQQFLREHPWARSIAGGLVWVLTIPIVVVPAVVFGWPSSAVFVGTAMAIGMAGLIEHVWLSHLRREASGNLVCSFCGLHQQQVSKLVAGPGVYICDNCIALCVEILETNDKPSQPEVAQRPPAEGETDVWAPPDDAEE